MAIPAIIARSFNLAFRGSAARANSPATTLWGLLRLAQTGKKPEAVDRFRQVFPSMSASDAEFAVYILTGGSPN